VIFAIKIYHLDMNAKSARSVLVIIAKRISGKEVKRGGFVHFFVKNAQEMSNG
jgi:hypothetical protein